MALVGQSRMVQVVAGVTVQVAVGAMVQVEVEAMDLEVEIHMAQVEARIL